ncbi:MAG: dissimilatory sulfite reductase D family protein [Candidatus Falkowbacteria bacterium]
MDYEPAKKKIIAHLKKFSEINYPVLRKELKVDPRTLKLYILRMIKEGIILCFIGGPVMICRLNEAHPQRMEEEMDYEIVKKLIVDELTKKLKTKSKFYFNDLAKILQENNPNIKMRDAKKIVNKMVAEGILEYWSSGSTTMYGLAGQGKQQ